MNNNSTPLNSNLKSNNSFVKNQLIRRIKVLINILLGIILFFFGIFFILISLYGMKNIFLYTLQLFKPGSWLDFSGRIELMMDYLTGISGIIAGNLFLFSGIFFIFQKKGLKLLLGALLTLFLNIILTIISAYLTHLY